MTTKERLLLSGDLGLAQGLILASCGVFIFLKEALGFGILKSDLSKFNLPWGFNLLRNSHGDFHDSQR